ncbi:dopa 4,5-dioxygenase [Rhizoctonia solani AG-3 Rhs1AP]|uniref:Dopa 4,5-dioxygenase n=1 Tax=Rhizoctonia solani AG-3 Rhs1AP TaxID=1086054 RepID=X8JSP5_9AGAM|nr:dopa 4,5-dioxygenase [Rhizoctonia solani AG-3 Rhs1AP]
MQVIKLAHEPPTDVERVVEGEIREWHFHIYFLQRNAAQHAAALALRNAILRLRRDGAFVAVPLYRVNTTPIGPHPAGSYEIWVPRESFVSVYSYICQHRGDLSVLVHPLTREEVKIMSTVKPGWGPHFHSIWIHCRSRVKKYRCNTPCSNWDTRALSPVRLSRNVRLLEERSSRRFVKRRRLRQLQQKTDGLSILLYYASISRVHFRVTGGYGTSRTRTERKCEKKLLCNATDVDSEMNAIRGNAQKKQLSSSYTNK